MYVAGYWTVAGFIKMYRNAESVVEDYLQGRKEPDPEMKKSVLEELERVRNAQQKLSKKKDIMELREA